MGIDPAHIMGLIRDEDEDEDEYDRDMFSYKNAYGKDEVT